MKPSEMKAKSASSVSAAVVSSSLAANAAAASAPLTNGLYYYPPTSSFGGNEASLNESTSALIASAPTAVAPVVSDVLVTPSTTSNLYAGFASTGVGSNSFPAATTNDFSSTLYSAAPIGSTNFDANASSTTGGLTNYAPLTMTASSFDYGINTSDFSTYAAGGFDTGSLSASYVPLSMDYNASYLNTTTADDPYGASLGNTNFDYSAFNNTNFSMDHTTDFYNSYGNNATFNSTLGSTVPYSSQYDDPNAYHGGVDYNNYDASTSNQYSNTGGYQQYGSYNSSGY